VLPWAVEWVAVALIGVTAAVDVVNLIVNRGPLGGYAAIALIGVGLAIGIRFPRIGVLVVAVSPILSAVAGWDSPAVWSMSSFAALWFSLRGLSGLYVGGVIAVANFVAVTISFGAIDFVKDPTASVAAFAAMVLAATGTAIRVNARYHAESAARLRTMKESRETEIKREIAQERLRVARDLHDSVGHQIAVVSMRLGSAEVHLPPEAAAAQADLEAARAALQTVLRETQAILRVLRDDDPPAEAPARRPSIHHLVTVLRDAGMRIDADVAELDDVPADVALTAYRIVEEALTNAQKYGAGTATLRVEVAADDAIRIDVANPVPEVLGRRPRTGGLGLIGMRERAEASGGTLDSRSEDGTFHVTATLPGARRNA
jgi:signal transduction histidine kinase